MNLRGVYQDGVIVPLPDPALPNGTPVRWQPEPEPKRTKRSRGTVPTLRKVGSDRRRMTKQERIAAAMQACGMYRDRPDWVGRSSAEIAAELRRRALGDRFHG